MPTLIKITNLTKDYVNDEVVTNVLTGVSFEINAGEFVAIMGPSGSGKSTLMHILGFLDRLTDGLYQFEGKDVSEFTDDQLASLRNKKVGFVFQSYNLLAKTTVLDNVRLPLIYSGRPQKEINELAQNAVLAVGLVHRTNHLSNQLSGGESQRVAIARALVNDPKVIFADEPTGNLDSRSGSQIMEILENLNNEGRTIILVTHELDTASHARRIIRLRDGQIVSDEQVANRRSAKEGELRK
ncbi:MAG: macrolide ABC transporter ATP-binding protein [Candidatus Buchananbacteria bacterium RIFCSPHIGHO2_01_FULL_39_14]|uniref:Macrolide ABC transporter ATP-binding protein n=1 Tax=Candidatus Buchananbacteria bacterium RIFCSPHIGHO2_01_FULL_39_14 TaxID=1797532 RepID=A0A1G1XWG8_9BACT|nr:MAG: macrolide ABC transporter ATP-binding protein [Candidatus Buchananbacteria bacterium RIFCSPHIGHO2_01_FULL_39_14]OGY48186.1 MAG: macrolide ABC transporter ATP-binding protein [Candidatus Buchananbacteria bacterium RIFCSPHIGHO2_02_FULL_39_17]